MIAATPLQSAIGDVDRLAEEIRRENDRRYTFYRMLTATDRVLHRLEDLNEQGVKRLSAGARRQMKTLLAELPMSCMEVFRSSDQVQEALDGIFEVQERLLRTRYPDRDIEEAEDAEAPDFTAADLERWAGVCEWLRGFEPAGLLRRDAGLRSADLEAMQDRGLVYLRDGSRWRVYTTWVRRLDALRARVEVG